MLACQERTTLAVKQESIRVKTGGSKSTIRARERAFPHTEVSKTFIRKGGGGTDEFSASFL